MAAFDPTTEASATIESIEIGYREMVRTALIGRTLTPQENYWAHISDSELEMKEGETVLIRGYFVYTGIFRGKRRRYFAQNCLYENGKILLFEAEGAGLYDDVEEPIENQETTD